MEKHRRWIEKHIFLQRERQEKARKFTPEEVAEYKRQALAVAQDENPRFMHRRMGVAPTGLKITSAVDTVGFLQRKEQHLLFLSHCACCREEAVDYIVVHELAHIRQKNHGPRFYAEVAKILPDYKRRIELLKQAQLELGL